MKEFIAVDFETANPQRVSACAIGYAKVSDGNVTESNSFLIKPIGGHALFQSKIHGIKDEHTCNKPDFIGIFPDIKGIFEYPLVGHSLFDKQVLNALSDHYSLGLNFSYTDSSAVAKEKLPTLKNHKLKTLVKHFSLPDFKHHDAEEDAIACAKIFLKLQGHEAEKKLSEEEKTISEFIGLAKGILADEEVNYKEAYELLYWLEDHGQFSSQHPKLHLVTQKALEDDCLDCFESIEIKKLLEQKVIELT